MHPRKLVHRHKYTRKHAHIDTNEHTNLHVGASRRVPPLKMSGERVVIDLSTTQPAESRATATLHMIAPTYTQKRLTQISHIHTYITTQHNTHRYMHIYIHNTCLHHGHGASRTWLGLLSYQCLALFHRIRHRLFVLRTRRIDREIVCIRVCETVFAATHLTHDAWVCLVRCVRR